MKEWTDDELGALLTETFASQESLADPAAAARTATLVLPRRHWPPVVAAAAAVVLVIGTVWSIVGHHDSTSPPVGGPTPAVSTTPLLERTDADNYAAAARESDRVINSLHLPPNAERISRKPRGWPKDAGFGMSPSEPSLTRTAWYQVSLPSDAVGRYLKTHPPAGMKAEGDGMSAGVEVFSYETVPQRRLAAYNAPTILVQYVGLNGMTSIRFDSVLASRHARSAASYLSGSVTSVDIERTEQRFTGAGSTRLLPRVRLTEKDDADRLAQLVAAINVLYGQVVGEGMHSCRPTLESTTYRFIFHTDTGDVTYDWADGNCDEEMTVKRGDELAGPPLDPGDLATTIRALLPA